jgi:hypothetical protein
MNIASATQVFLGSLSATEMWLGSVKIWARFFFTQLGQDIDGEAANNQSGISVSMNSAGDRVAIGADMNDGSGVSVGHVRVYSWNGTSWVKLGQDIDGEAAFDQSGRSVSMNSAGDRVAIGAFANDGGGANSGHVRVYSWNGTSWVKLGQDIDGEAAGDQSGISVSLNSAGNRVAIGANWNGGSGLYAGHVRVYSWSGTSWVKLGQDIDGEAANDESGISVSVNSAGDRVAIGARYNSGSGADAGHVRVYSWNGTSWVKLGQDIDGETANDRSGISVSLNSVGNRVAIGANWNDGTGVDSGHVRVYSWNGTSWVKLGQDIDGEAAGDQSGVSVSLNSEGDRVAIGANWNDGTGVDSGHVRVYSWNGTSWGQLGQDIDGEAAGDQSGFSVSLNSEGDRVAIGAPFNSTTDAGHVRVYAL